MRLPRTKHLFRASDREKQACFSMPPDTSQRGWQARLRLDMENPHSSTLLALRFGISTNLDGLGVGWQSPTQGRIGASNP